ncbi:MAG TPA: hypothetical protein VE783_06440 [Candidatus Limnocylindrales bacterium]|nr:hypothetical protein [Candidatus Limnocylindrales bacterium]
MNRRHSKLLFVLLLVSVTLLFFIHLPSGSFQSTNGPTTPVSDWRMLLITLFAILYCCSSLMHWTDRVDRIVAPVTTFQASAISISASAELPLRC